MANNNPQLAELLRLFDANAAIPPHQIVRADQVPEPYQRLLVHPQHMTVTIEEFYGGPVSVRVLDRRRDPETYARKIVLERENAGVVLFGIVRIQLRHCGKEVRQAILAEQTPLGRILIEYDVLRRIEPTSYFRLEAESSISHWFATTALTYGRLGIIYCDNQPAVELLEIPAPITKPPSG